MTAFVLHIFMSVQDTKPVPTQHLDLPFWANEIKGYMFFHRDIPFQIKLALR